MPYVTCSDKRDRLGDMLRLYLCGVVMRCNKLLRYVFHDTICKSLLASFRIPVPKNGCNSACGQYCHLKPSPFYTKGLTVHTKNPILRKSPEWSPLSEQVTYTLSMAPVQNWSCVVHARDCDATMYTQCSSHLHGYQPEFTCS